jgi:circadian clock protein KaiC
VDASSAQSDRQVTAGTTSATPAEQSELASTGIGGLDTILRGGLPRSQSYLVQGAPGAGKTTLALQFCMAGAALGERVLYISTSESEDEIRAVATGHGWSLDGITIHHHDSGRTADDTDQSVFVPAEVELPRTLETMLAVVGEESPQRLVLDSLSEIRYLALNPLWFRRQLLTLKQELAALGCTTILCDDLVDQDAPAQTIVHGVIGLEQRPTDYGPDRRRLRILKLRGREFGSGYHDFAIRTGGIEVYPRLVAAEHRVAVQMETVSTGLPGLDGALGGGLDRGTATLLLGPAGTGKSTLAVQVALAAAERGELVVVYAFDERLATLRRRSRSLGLPLERHLASRTIELLQVDPTELTPGEFSENVRRAVRQQGARMVVIDSLAGYFHAMPTERLLNLHLHELLSYLSQLGVTSLLVMTQHGVLAGERRVSLDLSYVSDSVVLFHVFEHAGELRKAMSVFKRRSGPHEPGIRQLEFGPGGIQIGDVLQDFRGILTGVPDFTDPLTSLVDSDARSGRRSSDR